MANRIRWLDITHRPEGQDRNLTGLFIKLRWFIKHDYPIFNLIQSHIYIEFFSYTIQIYIV